VSSSGARGSTILKLNALRIDQRGDVPLFVFGVDGRKVHQFASVDDAHRTKDGVLQGYQRERVKGHINAIYRYLESSGSILPNAIVLALGRDVRFMSMPGMVASEWGTVGRLDIPLPRRGEAKPSQIVDGQQRVSALAMLGPERRFPVVVVGFQAESEEVRRQQFVLVNRTKPLPRDLLNELLPHISGELPHAMALRRVAGQVLENLRFDRSSPFYGRIRGLGASGEGANIAQASVLGLIEKSIRGGGVLSEPYHESAYPDIEAMVLTVNVFFKGVQRVWPYAWSGNPWNSRLVHGVGLAALGALMDMVMTDVKAVRPRAVASVERRLRPIAGQCAWTEGRWPGMNVAWNELQNTSQDKRRLATHLRDRYARANG
jgi:DGQHR domain-containing protein